MFTRKKSRRISLRRKSSLVPLAASFKQESAGVPLFTENAICAGHAFTDPAPYKYWVHQNHSKSSSTALREVSPKLPAQPRTEPTVCILPVSKSRIWMKPPPRRACSQEPGEILIKTGYRRTLPLEPGEGILPMPCRKYPVFDVAA